jgi:hypothetical protein
MRSFKGLLTARLMHSGFSATESDLDQYLDRYEAALANTEHPPPWLRFAIGQQLAQEIDIELYQLRLSLEFAERGIPTYSHVSSAHLGAAPVGAAAARKTDLAIARFYFQNQLRVPSPASFSEALDLRDDQRIEAWRSQILNWANELTSGVSSYNTILEAIQEANSYVEGARFAQRLVPKWSHYVTLPTSAASMLVTDSHWGQLIGVGLLVCEAIQAWGDAAVSSVEGPNPLYHKWFLVGNNE